MGIDQSILYKVYYFSSRHMNDNVAAIIIWSWKIQSRDIGWIYLWIAYCVSSLVLV